MWCGVNRQRAERSRALGPVRPTSDATRAANAAQPTARRRRQRRRPTHPRNTHERAATSDATNTFMVLISEIKKKNQNPKLSNSLNRSLRSTHTQDLLPTTQHLHTHEPTHAHPQEEE